MKAFAGVIVAIVVVVAVAVGGYKLNWWLAEDGTNRQTVIDRQSTAFVTSRIEKVRDDILELASVPEGPQKVNMTRSICAAVADIDMTIVVPSDVQQFAAQNC